MTHHVLQWQQTKQTQHMYKTKSMMVLYVCMHVCMSLCTRTSKCYVNVANVCKYAT